MLDSDDCFKVTLRSYDKYLMSAVKIECKNYDVFKEIVDVVKPILRKEENKKK